MGRSAADEAIAAASLAWLGLASGRRREFAAAEQQAAEARSLYHAIGDGHGIAWATHGLGSAVANQGEYERALPFFEESLQRFQALGDHRSVAIASLELGALDAIMAGGDLDRAGRLLRDGLRGLLAVGDRAFMISGLLTLAADPSTAFPWAVGLLNQIEGSVLLARDGDGHTSYFLPGPSRTRDAIDAYLITGALPPPNTVYPD